MTFLGDSWTHGTGANPRDDGWAYAAGKELGYVPAIISQNEAGYVTASPTGGDIRSVAQRVNDVLATFPDVVVVAAGRYDANPSYSAERVENAIGATLGNLRNQVLRGTKVIVVGPFWASGQPTQSILAVRDVVKSKATGNGMAFIDPIGERWITGSPDGTVPGNRSEYIGADGTPTPEGHSYIRDRFVADVRSRDLVPSKPR